MPAKTCLSLCGRASDTAVRLSDIVWSPAFADEHLGKRTPSERLGSWGVDGQLRPRSCQVKSDLVTSLIDLNSPAWSWDKFEMETNILHYDLKLIRFERRDESVF